MTEDEREAIIDDSGIDLRRKAGWLDVIGAMVVGAGYSGLVIAVSVGTGVYGAVLCNQDHGRYFASTP